MKAAGSFIATRTKAIARITEAMSSKLELFGLSEYDWTSPTRQDSPSVYLYELVNWLTTVVDSLALKDTYKEEAYRGAVGYIASCFLVCTVHLLSLSYPTPHRPASLGPRYSRRVNLSETDFFYVCVLQDFLTGRDIPMVNENAIANLLLDIAFLDEELKRNGNSHGAAFTELRSVRTTPFPP